jgi:hypothetical protein
MKLIQTLISADGTRRARVFWDKEWQEYRVCFAMRPDGKGTWLVQQEADYFTSEREDALRTAEQYTPGHEY